MDKKEINIKIDDKVIKVSFEELINLLPKESINLLPKRDETLMVKIPLIKLEKVGFSLNDYEVIFQIKKEEEKLCMSIYNGYDDFLHLLKKYGYHGCLLNSRK